MRQQEIRRPIYEHTFLSIGNGNQTTIFALGAPVPRDNKRQCHVTLAMSGRSGGPGGDLSYSKRLKNVIPDRRSSTHSPSFASLRFGSDPLYREKTSSGSIANPCLTVPLRGSPQTRAPYHSGVARPSVARAFGTARSFADGCPGPSRDARSLRNHASRN